MKIINQTFFSGSIQVWEGVELISFYNFFNMCKRGAKKGGWVVRWLGSGVVWWRQSRGIAGWGGLVVTVLLLSCRSEPTGPPYESQLAAQFDTTAVATAHPLASEVGADILRAGGNAIDAAVATQFALAVVYPRAGNIGGGGFLVLRLADGTAAALDYRERAPAAATRDMYLDAEGNPIDSLSRSGHWAVGVPGTVSGLAMAHERYGSLPWAQLVQPAVDLAREGFALSATEAERFRDYHDYFVHYNPTPNAFTGRSDWQAGMLFMQPDLAQTLERIRDRGAAGFYAGETADLLVAEMQRGGGLITHEDLRDYAALWREPIRSDYHDYQIIGMPPPSSGGVAVAQLLRLSDNYPLAEYGFHSTETIHLMAEIERRVYADRAKHLGDADFYPVPLDTLLDEGYLRRRMQSFDPLAASRSDSLAAGQFLMPESFETTHTSIVDAERNAVSVTTTLNLNFGSKVLVAGGGFFLNDEMDDFSAKPGTPNYFGLVGAEANAIAPGKRMLSSMSPTIVERDGELFLVLGAPGGSTIITAVYQVFLNIATFGMTTEEAVAAGRFHHQWLPDVLRTEEDVLPDSTVAALEALGHTVEQRGRMAVIKAIQVLPDGTLSVAADPRNPDDDVAGF